MDLEVAKLFIRQALAMAMNYHKTGRANKAVEIFASP